MAEQREEINPELWRHNLDDVWCERDFFFKE